MKVLALHLREEVEEGQDMTPVTTMAGYILLKGKIKIHLR